MEATRETANVAITDLSNSIDQLRQGRNLDQKNLEIELAQLRKLIRDLEAAIEDGDEGGAIGVVSSGPAPGGFGTTGLGGATEPLRTSGGLGGTDALRTSGGLAGASIGLGGASGNGAMGITVGSNGSSMQQSVTVGSTGFSRHKSGGHHHHKSDALATFVEAAWMGVACELQDEKDRKAIGLIGVKPANMSSDKGSGLPDISPKKGAKSSPSTSPRRNRGEKQKKAGGGYDSGEFSQSGFTEPVVSIDPRCLSCSGASPTVLAGFKMACLQYQPGLVEYDGAFYSRTELVSKRAELLLQARAALKPQHNPTARSLD